MELRMSERYLISGCCNAAIDLSTAVSDRVECPTCRRVFEIRLDIDFAEYSTSSMEEFRWSDDGSYILKFYFENFTLESLEGIAEQIKLLPPSERRPSKLLPLFKAIHDCLKKRLQQYLVRDDVPNLPVDTKAQIEVDEPTQNVGHLAGHLLMAYPESADRLQGVAEHEYLKMLMWLRNKEEHLPVAAWPMKSFVHISRDKLPGEATGAYAELTVQLATRMQNFCVDFLKAIYDVCGRDIEEWQYNRLDEYRIHCTT
jgi:hypothetical protein